MRKPTLNPFVCGIGLGITLLISFVVLGDGLGASNAVSRFAFSALTVVTPSHAKLTYFASLCGSAPLSNYLVTMFIGTFVGGIISSRFSKRNVAPVIERGAKSSKSLRITLAIAGGILVGFAARLALGCTSGQALSGSALLLTGSHIFMLTLFAAGFLLAPLFRKQWND